MAKSVVIYYFLQSSLFDGMGEDFQSEYTEMAQLRSPVPCSDRDMYQK